jgi:transcriptional regulator of arginine metabolism
MHRTAREDRYEKILEILSTNQIATQQELATQLARSGFASTQSSVSRDIVKLGLTKLDGYYVAPKDAMNVGGPVTAIDTAGDNLIVVKTEVGLAQPAALTIDRANIGEIVGTVAGDDTILIAVKNAAAQRLAVKKIVKLFAPRLVRTRRASKQPSGEIVTTYRSQ